MACNSCAKPFTLLRKEKGCPGCGFSYCSKCLEHKVFLKKLNSDAKVCAKCMRSLQSDEQKPVQPPDAYFKRIGLMKDNSVDGKTVLPNEKDKEIQNRLQKLKEKEKVETSEDEIKRRLQNIKGEMPSTSDGELQERLAKLRGVPISTVQSQPVLITADQRSEQEQIEELLKEYQEQASIDTKYTNEFNALVGDMESRLSKLKTPGDNGGPSKGTEPPNKDHILEDSEDEEDAVRKIVEKIKAEAHYEDDEIGSPTDELPFCEICNEDATMRCLGCRYLFCKRCFLDHKDDDDGCDKYEPYTPPNRSTV